MIQDLYITNPKGDTLQLNLRTALDDHGLLVFNLEGLGSPKATVTGLSGPTYDGIMGYFVRTDSRHLLLTLAIPKQGTSEETGKGKVYEFFPIKETIIFRIVTDNVDAHIDAIVESVEMNQFAKVENAVISLYCPNPYFLDALESWEYAEYGGVSKTVTYEGTVAAGAFFYIYCGDPYGPVTITISNDRGNQSMSLDYSYFDTGDKLHINTRLGEKKVTHWNASTGTWTDITHLVKKDSQWIKLYPGDNVISVALTGTYQGPESSNPNDANLVLYIPLNEWNPGSTLDLQDVGVVSDIGGTVGSNAGKYYPKSRQFVPANAGYIRIFSLEEDYNPTGDFTVCFWLRANDIASSQSIISVYQDSNNGFKISLDTSGNIRFAIKRAGSEQVVNKSFGSTGVWRHVFCWYDAATDIMYVSINNDAPSTRTNTLSPNTYSSTWYIGANHTPSAYLDGRLESVMLYSVVLSSSERTWIYNGGRGLGYSGMVDEHEICVSYQKQYQGI